MKDDMVCKFCIFWKSHSKLVETGTCRFSAPKVEISEESSYDAVWPITESKDWCGDFQSDTF